MKYEDAKQAYLRANRKFKVALADRARRLSSLTTQNDRSTMAGRNLESAREKLLAAMGTPDEKAAVADYATARDLAEGARVMVEALDDVPHVLISLNDEMIGTASDFRRAIVLKEMEAFPQEAVEVLKRAFAIYGGDSERYSEFLAFVLSFDRLGFSMVDIQATNAKVQADHGMVV
jgi:hypothetical protein